MYISDALACKEEDKYILQIKDTEIKLQSSLLMIQMNKCFKIAESQQLTNKLRMMVAGGCKMKRIASRRMKLTKLLILEQ